MRFWEVKAGSLGLTFIPGERDVTPPWSLPSIELPMSKESGWTFKPRTWHLQTPQQSSGNMRSPTPNPGCRTADPNGPLCRCPRVTQLSVWCLFWSLRPLECPSPPSACWLLAQMNFFINHLATPYLTQIQKLFLLGLLRNILNSWVNWIHSLCFFFQKNIFRRWPVA